MAEHMNPSARALPTDQAVVVIGAGTMGSGIAEIAASAGHRVYLRDTSEAALERGVAQIRRSLDKRVQRGRLDAAQRDAIIDRLKPVNAQAKLENVGLVIEVIVENLGAGAVPLDARLHRQPGGPTLLRRSAAPAAGAGCNARHAGRGVARVGWIQDGPVRID